jgi:hypothetical protein
MKEIDGIMYESVSKWNFAQKELRRKLKFSSEQRANLIDTPLIYDFPSLFFNGKIVLETAIKNNLIN